MGGAVQFCSPRAGSVLLSGTPAALSVIHAVRESLSLQKRKEDLSSEDVGCRGNAIYHRFWL